MKFAAPGYPLSALMIPFAVASSLGMAAAQNETHGRKYKAAEPTAHIVVMVEKSFNGKPMPNAAVIFHAVRNGLNDGNLEVKTDPEGKATIDVIEIGSKVTVQVIASGFATYAEDVVIDGPSKEMLVKMVRPRAQISKYTDTTGEPSQMKPGVQEPPHPVAPQAVVPQAAPPAAPSTATPGSPK